MSEVLAGRYELGASLGAGGMARVVTARDRVLDRIVAVKLVPVEQARSADPALAARFVAEARTTARFTHRNVVTVYDAGESDGYLYIVNEFVNGTTLAHRLAEQGALGIGESVRIGQQLLSALGAAHMAGIVHRDVKPSNVLLDANGNVKLADFGIAKRLDDLEAALTAAGEFVGTPRYVAPEQAAGQRATPATDLYAVGVVMYEMLSGRAPFDAETPMATLLAHRDAPVPDVRQDRPEVPAALAAAITMAMAKQPDDRFGSADEMRAAMTTTSASIGTDPTVAAVGVPLGATAVYARLDPLAVPPHGAFAQGGKDGGGESDDQRSGNQMWWWAAVAVLLIVGIVAITQAGGGDGSGGGGANADGSSPANAASGPSIGTTSDAPSTPPPSAAPQPTAPPQTAAPTAAPTTATTPPPTPPPTEPPSTEAPPSTEPPSTEPPPPQIPELPTNLGDLIATLGADPSAIGPRGGDLLSELEDVAAKSGGDQRQAAREAIEELDEWVQSGELEPGAAATIRSVLQQLAGDGDDNDNGNGDDED